MNSVVSVDDSAIPETWDTIEEFTKWYIDVGMPIFPPFDAKVYVTDHTYSNIIFRHDVYQVEQYFISPNSWVPPHSHPDFENIIVYLSGELWYDRADSFEEIKITETTPFEELNTIGKIDYTPTDKNLPHTHFSSFGGKLVPGQYHAFKTSDRGCTLLSIGKWTTKNYFLTSAILSYSGEKIGPVHQETINSFNKI